VLKVCYRSLVIAAHGCKAGFKIKKPPKKEIEGTMMKLLFVPILACLLLSCASLVPKLYVAEIKSTKKIALIAPLVLMNRFSTERFCQLDFPPSTKIPESDDVDEDTSNDINTSVELAIKQNIESEFESYLSELCKIQHIEPRTDSLFPVLKDIDRLFYDLQSANSPGDVKIGNSLLKCLSASESNQIFVIRYWGFAKTRNEMTRDLVASMFLPSAAQKLLNLNVPFGSTFEIAFIDKRSSSVAAFNYNIDQDQNPISMGTIESHCNALLKDLYSSYYN